MTSINQQFRAEVRANGSGAWIDIAGEIDLASVCRLREALAEALSYRPDVLYLAMGGVSFMDSSGVAALSRVQKEGLRRGYTVVIHAPTKAVRRVLELSGLDRQVTIENG
jgi:anti-anti-sigma factor